VEDEGHPEVVDLAGTAPAASPVGLAPRVGVDSCRFLHRPDGPSACLAIAPAIHLGSRQVALVCAGPTHAACPRFAQGRIPVAPPVAAPPPAAMPPAATPPAATPPVTPPLAAVATELPDDVAVAVIASSPTAGVRPSEPASAEAIVSSIPSPDSTATVETATVRGATAVRATRPSRTGEPDPTARPIVGRTSVAAAALTFVAALVLAIGFVDAHGGLTLFIASPSPGFASPGPPGAAVVSPSAIPPSAPTESDALSPPPTAPATTSPGVTPTTVAPSLPPGLLALLVPCPGVPGCSAYHVRSGDTLSAVARLFGVSYAALLAANPTITNPSLIHVGQLVTIPLGS